MENEKTILVVDDEEDIRQILSSFLQKEGYECLVAASGEKALTLLKDNDIDLVILDIMMPEMDGFEVLEKLRNDTKTERIPVIMLTGVEGKSKVKEALDKGVTYYITKPFETIDLASKIRVALSEELK